MNYEERFAISCYQTLVPLNEDHPIFLVRHPQTGRICVKKILSVYNPDVFRFLQEHPVAGTPEILAICESERDHTLTVIEEYISGITLEEQLKIRPLSPEEIRQYFSELCDIAGRLHQCVPPIVHRDIKPSNIILTSCHHLMLLDFNAAKNFLGPAASDTTLLGTRGYAAPEQYGFGSSSPQTDIYAMGVLLQEISQIYAQTPEGEHFLEIAARCTRMDPAERFASAPELKEAFQAPFSVPGTGKEEAKSSFLPEEKAASKEKESGKHFEFQAFLPPGFRSRTFWKMIYASLAYLLIFWLSFTLKVEGASGTILWLNRISCLLVLLSFPAAILNYRGIQRLIPLCRSKKLPLRITGILLLELLLFVIIMTPLTLVTSLL